MNEQKFKEVFKGRRQSKREILLETSTMTEDTTADISCDRGISVRSNDEDTAPEIVMSEVQDTSHTEGLIDDVTGMTAEEFLAQEFTWE